MGRPRKPASTKILQGTFQKCRNPIAEPTPEVGDVRSCPKYIGYYGQKLWKDIVQEMVDCGIITKLDWSILELCCVYYDQFRRAEKSMRVGVDEQGNKFKQDFTAYFDGKATQSQGVYNAMNKASDNFMRYAVQLGMTPAARNKIDLVQRKEPEMSETERILNEVASG